MTTTAKALQVFALFKRGLKQIRARDVERALNVSAATTYRYLSDLEAAGFIERVAAGAYVLGPEIVELDYLIRINDPLIGAARSIMHDLAEQTGGVALLCRLHSSQVVCVYSVSARHCPLHVSYERGRAMPLYRGATSKVILANLAPEDLQMLLQRHRPDFEDARLPGDYSALAAYLAQIRAQKVCFTAGEVDEEVHGWAAPLRYGPTLMGSLSVVAWRHAKGVNMQHVPDKVLRAALRIEGRLQNLAEGL